jgi:hypothetical protein
MKGRGGLLCYSPTFSLLRASRGRALGPCVYSADNKVGGNYYAQWKKMRCRGESNPRPRLWYHARRLFFFQFNHKTQVIWKGRGGLLCYSPTIYSGITLFRFIYCYSLVLVLLCSTWPYLYARVHQVMFSRNRSRFLLLLVSSLESC